MAISKPKQNTFDQRVGERMMIEAMYNILRSFANNVSNALMESSDENKFHQGAEIQNELSAMVAGHELWKNGEP